MSRGKLGFLEVAEGEGISGVTLAVVLGTSWGLGCGRGLRIMNRAKLGFVEAADCERAFGITLAGLGQDGRCTRVKPWAVS